MLGIEKVVNTTFSVDPQSCSVPPARNSGPVQLTLLSRALLANRYQCVDKSPHKDAFSAAVNAASLAQIPIYKHCPVVPDKEESKHVGMGG